jgi:carbon-monoxide dehydrogenase iron sulfur subunit
MIRVDIGKCTGCRSCETACSFFRSGRVGNRLSRIKVMNLYETGIDGPVVCVQCEERFCLNCPENAIVVGNLGEIIVQPTICTRCGSCIRQCPIGAIDEHNDIIYVCDLCGGRPKCVDACTESAIIFDPDFSLHPSLSGLKENVSKFNPSEKRRAYIEGLGNQVRSTWRERHE